MAEVLPITLGIVIGLAFGMQRRAVRVVVSGAAALGAALIATIVSGEFRVSWMFLVTDIAVLLIAALASHLVASRARSMASATRRRHSGP